MNFFTLKIIPVYEILFLFLFLILELNVEEFLKLSLPQMSEIFVPVIWTLFLRRFALIIFLGIKERRKT